MNAVIPNEVREAAWDAAFPGLPECVGFDESKRRAGAAAQVAWDAAAAHFAKERDDLQAVIAEALAATNPGLSAHAILSASPSGTADRLRAEGWERGGLTLPTGSRQGSRFPARPTPSSPRKEQTANE